MIEFDHRAFLETLTTRPGVYSMLDSAGKVIYVGKAKNLKKRVASYYSTGKQTAPKTQALVQAIAAIEITVTHTENEALILENNLIKQYRPRYNIWFKDDKSYPYIYLSSHQRYPGLSYYRGPRHGKGRYFGPYPGAGAARQTLQLLQKLFQVRSCKDSFFVNRTRPCLQYQIKRCSAPCVDLISASDYQKDVAHTVMFLEGKNAEVIEALLDPMQKAAESLDYERAAHYRDQIANLRKVQEHQYISSTGGDADVIACDVYEGSSCVHVMFIRGGLNLGGKNFFPKLPPASSAADVIEAFVPQFYLSRGAERVIPREVLLNHAPAGTKLLQAVLSEKAGRNITVKNKLRGERAQWINMARENADVALKHHLAGIENIRYRLDALQTALGLDEPVARIECFDISHTQGEAMVAACVVFGAEGAITSAYRRYNIEGITPGDDYAAMQQVLERRYMRVKKEEGSLPDLILIDGGRGQVSAAVKILEELQLMDIALVGVAKGPSRKPGEETLVLESGRRMIRLAPDSAALHLIQTVRDEAHRFAITGHRLRRKKIRQESVLEHIEGIGSKRRHNLIRYFGGIQGIAQAGVEDLATVPGINKNLARKIYVMFHQ
jgi:excinuclease ABC subunit C